MIIFDTFRAKNDYTNKLKYFRMISTVQTYRRYLWVRKLKRLLSM